ncbi:MAG TPA: glycosyltransferase family 1 protein [Candidatus Scalindua sp.]|nr:glycosyltransferase family 1 protein [Candidatus Scalindua sp.]
MKIMVFAGYVESLLIFRGPLLSALVKEGNQVIACAPENNANIVKRLSKLGVGFQTIPIQRTGMNPVHDIYTLFFLYRLLRKNRPDILLSYTIKPVIFGSLAARLAGVKNCYSMITGLGFAFQGDTLKNKFINFLVCCLYRLGLSKNKAVFFQNPDDKELFIKSKLIGKNTDAILVNGSGVDLNYYTIMPVVKEPIVFLLIARIISEKGIEVYAEAARQLKKRYSKVSFRLAGWFDSNPSALKKAKVMEWHKQGTVEYLGVADDVRPFIAASSVYVLPSYREGTPRTVLEAMSMGRPIITTDAPGCRETVIDGENGFLIPIKDAVALAKAMERFILNPELIELMGRSSREMAKQKYDVNKVNAVVMKTMGLIGEEVV